MCIITLKKVIRFIYPQVEWSGYSTHISVNMFCFLGYGSVNSLQTATWGFFLFVKDICWASPFSLGWRVCELLEAWDFFTALQRAVFKCPLHLTTHPIDCTNNRILCCSLFHSCISTFCKSKTIMKPFRNNNAEMQILQCY